MLEYPVERIGLNEAKVAVEYGELSLFIGMSFLLRNNIEGI